MSSQKEPQSHDLPVSRPRVSVAEMISELRAGASNIESSQEALVKSGMRDAPHAGQMKRVAAYDAAADILEVILPYWDDVVGLVKRLRYRGPRRG